MSPERKALHDSAKWYAEEIRAAANGAIDGNTPINAPRVWALVEFLEDVLQQLRMMDTRSHTPTWQRALDRHRLALVRDSA